jgi:cytochrome c5
MCGSAAPTGRSKLARLCAVLAVLFGAALPAGSQTVLPEGGGKRLVQMACTRCHGVEKFTVERHTHDDWAEEVDVMMRYGAPLNKGQAAQVSDYLTKSRCGSGRGRHQGVGRGHSGRASARSGGGS